MIRKVFLFLIILGFSTVFCLAQKVVSPSDLFRRPDNLPVAGKLNIIQDPSIDTLISRYIMINENLKQKNNYYGMIGVRIQIYSSSERNARVESNKVYQEFTNKFPDIKPHPLFDPPVYYKIRVGDFRSKTEAIKLYLIISKEFPDAYMVPNCYINFPDLNIK